MGHHHHHHHSTAQKGKPLFIAIALNLAITIAQVIGGVISGSLALIGDALHNFSDVLSLLISYIANVLSGRSSTESKTFGYKRAQILAAFINALTLIGVSVYLIIESVQRFGQVTVIKADWVMALALAGILVNGGSVFLLSAMQKGDSNLRAAFLHLIGDLATSVAVLIGGIAMHFYQVYWVDGVITVGVSIYLIVMAAKLFLHTTSVLMQFVPSHLNVSDICNELRKIKGIEALHHVHLWRLNDESIHFEAHVRLEENITVSAFDALRTEMEQVLQDQFEIDHCLFQPEFGQCSETELVIQE